MSIIKDAVASMRSKTRDTELRNSLEANGWVVHFPAIQDENGVTLVGNRRMRLAGELGIKPVIKTLKLGTGEAADAERVKLAFVSNIGGAPLTAKDRKRLAVHLHKYKWSQQRIGDALGVTQQQVSLYLKTLQATCNVSEDRGTDTLGRRKSSGRRRKPKQHKYAEEVEQAAAELFLDESRSVVDIAAELGISDQVVIRSTEREIGRREERADPQIDPATLSMTAQQKLEAATRQMHKSLTVEYERKFQAQLKEHMEGYILPRYRELEEQANKVIKARKGLFTAAEYNLILKCLHPDKLGLNADPELVGRHNRAMQVFTKHKLVLVAEAEFQQPNTVPLPNSVAELMALREKAKQERAAQRRAATGSKANMARSH